MINIDGVDRDILDAELRLLLDKFVVKHATKPEKIVARTGDIQPYTNRHTIAFYDGRLPVDAGREVIGYMVWTHGDRNMEYMVHSRLIHNEKYRWDKRECHANRTKDVNKALKIALEKILPFQAREFVEDSRSRADSRHTSWVNELSSSSWKLRADADIMAEELDNLLAQGVTFVTEEFKQAVASLPKYKEHIARRENTPRLQCVLNKFDNFIVVPQDNNGILGFEATYNAFDALPEKIRNNISLLKLASRHDYMPNVGFKESDTIFWVYDKDVF